MLEITDEYLGHLYNDLDRLVPGRILDLKVIRNDDERNRYVEGVKRYIDAGGHNVEFNSDYTRVRKLTNFGVKP